MSFKKVPSFLVNLFEAEMNGGETQTYRFNSFLLDVAERQLVHAGTPVPLTPKAFDVLVYLVAHGGHLVLKDDLMQAVWPDSFVDEVNLPRTIHTLRRALHEDDNGNKFIETVPTKGYRFIPKVEEINGRGADLPSFQPADDLDSRKFEILDSEIIENSSATAEDLQATKREVAQRSHLRPVLILTIAFILAVSVSGFWFADRSWIARTGVNGLMPQTNSGEAYQHYQRGRFFVERKHKGDLENALASFEKATELDPNYAAAYAGKADVKIWMFWSKPSHEEIIQVRSAINKALELDKSNSYAHALSCRILATYDWEFSAAEKECRLAVELGPNDPEAHRELAFLRNVFGREDEAMREIDAAIALAPTSFNKRSRGLILYHFGRYDEAIEQLLQVDETDPNFEETDKWLIRAYEMKKDYARALEVRMRQMKRAGASQEEIEALGATYEKEGWPGVLRSMIEGPGKSPINTAQVYAQLGDTEKAFEYLDAGFAKRGVMMTLIAREPRFDPIRDDPRFDELLKRIGLK